MIPRQLFRFVHTNVFLETSKKSLLAKLRKKTGYTFANCKKALELHNDDVVKAEEWLKTQAQEHGWTQAVKLKSRITSQGLIALITDKNHGALVEVNCETDFVARNKKFHELAETIVTTILKHGKTIENNALVNKTMLYTEAIKAMSTVDGKTVGDHTALTIGSIGENINIRRALCISVNPEIKLFGCTHPTPINPVPTSFGRYGALVAIKQNKDNEALGIQLCQHVIGMNPLKIGDPQTDEPNNVIDDEPLMLYQEFLLDPSVSVQQFLMKEEAEIVDFVRFEMGETLVEDEILNSVETCG